MKQLAIVFIIFLYQTLPLFSFTAHYELPHKSKKLGEVNCKYCTVYKEYKIIGIFPFAK